MIDTQNKEWIMDSGAFQELYINGKYTYSINDYLQCVKKFNPTIFVNMDYMCEEHMLKKTNKTIKEHQKLTTENHIKIKQRMIKLGITSKFMGVIQGWHKEDYLKHIKDLKSKELIEEYMAIGSICRRKNLGEIIDIIVAIHNVLPNTKLHAFGVKLKIFSYYPEIINYLESADSAAWSYNGRMHPVKNGIMCKLTNNKCVHSSNLNCANCEIYMLNWYNKIRGILK